MNLKGLPDQQTAPPKEQPEPIVESWGSAPDELLTAPSSHIAELDRRLREFAGQPAKALSCAEARIRLRSRTSL